MNSNYLWLMFSTFLVFLMQPDLIFMDIRMPVMDGYAAIAKILLAYLKPKSLP